MGASVLKVHLTTRGHPPVVTHRAKRHEVTRKQRRECMEFVGKCREQKRVEQQKNSAVSLLF